MHKLQYISQGNSIKEHLENIEDVLNAGCRYIQLRLKNVSDTDLISAAVTAKGMCLQHGAELIINDHPEIALKCKAKGFHLGLNDMPVDEARKISGGMVIGGSANTLEDIEKRVKENVDYIGLGPFRFTQTKEKLSPILGIEGYRMIIDKMKMNNWNIPVYAIGGIDVNDCDILAKAGVYGVAVSGSLTKAENKKEIIDRINKIFAHA